MPAMVAFSLRLNDVFLGFLVIYLYTSHTSAQKVALVLSANCAVITSVDFVRLRNPRFARFYERTLGFLMRDSEKVCGSVMSVVFSGCLCKWGQTKTNGVIWYLLGCIFVLALYPQDIAVVSILMYVFPPTLALQLTHRINCSSSLAFVDGTAYPGAIPPRPSSVDFGGGIPHAFHDPSSFLGPPYASLRASHRANPSQVSSPVL